MIGPMWEMIGVGVSVISVAMIAIVLLAKVLKLAYGKKQAGKRRRRVEPSPPRRHVMTPEERAVHRAIQNAKEHDDVLS